MSTITRLHRRLGDFGALISKVGHLMETHKTLDRKCKDLETYYRKLNAQEMKPVYESYSTEAANIEEDLKEANRRKPKKAKAAGKAGKETASS